jgi:hypothetical protein
MGRVMVVAMRYRARYTTRYAMQSWYDDPALLEEVVTLRPRREEWV